MAAADSTITITLDPEVRKAIDDASELVDDLAKAGKRNSAADTDRIRKIKASLETALGLISDLGVAEELEDEDTTEKAAPATSEASANADEPAASAETEKGVSLDVRVGAVGSAISSMNRSDVYPSKPYDEWLQMAACYEDFVVVREGICHWKLTYSLDGHRCELAPRAEWEKVEIDWKPAPEGEAKAVDLEPALIKSLGGGKIGHYSVLWGSQKKRDLTGEWFARDTAEMDAIFKAVGKLPLLYHHAMDGTLKTTVVGLVEKLQADDVGLWAESQLDMANAYSSAILHMVEKKALGTSSGTLPGGRGYDKTSGKITRWPIVEISLTPTPAEPRMRSELPVAVLKSHFLEAGLPLPDQFDVGAAEARSDLDVERERLALLSLTL